MTDLDSAGLSVEGGVIDCHQHFWEADLTRHPWLPAANPALFRDYRPGLLAVSLAEGGVIATVAIQASPNAADTESLIAIALDHPWIAGVVGWVDPHLPDCVEHLATLAATPKFRGIRPGIRRRPNEQWVPDPQELAAFDAAGSLGLSIDLLVNHHQLGVMADLARNLPQVALIVDHAGAPPPGTSYIEWQRSIEMLSRHSNIFCKFSGLRSMGDHADEDFVERVADTLLSYFGPNRVAWGSDWPISLQAVDYASWLGQSVRTMDRLGGKAAVDAVMHRTARTFYRLD